MGDPWFTPRVSSQAMVKTNNAAVRARQLMAAAGQRVPQVSITDRLAQVRKVLRQEFPGKRNLTRLITRATEGQQQHKRHPTKMTPGPVPLISRATKVELNACCRAVKAGRRVRGEQHGIRWTPAVVRQLPPCQAVMTKYKIKDARTLMAALLAYDPDISLMTPCVKPAFTHAQMADRLGKAQILQQYCEKRKGFHSQTFMLDEAHSYASQLLKRPPGRVVLPGGTSKQHVYTECRRTAGAVDRTCYARLVVVNPCAGPVNLTWLRPTPGVTVPQCGIPVSKG
jgi:hypothetical protein